MKIAVVQVRGALGLTYKQRDTLRLLNLPKSHSCVIINGTPSYLGMLNSLKDFLTWGEIDLDTFKILLEKRGRFAGNQALTKELFTKLANQEVDTFAQSFLDGKKNFKDVPGLKPYFRLKPPRHGFERGGVKKPYSMGGALGYRKNDINDLIRRMI